MNYMHIVNSDKNEGRLHEETLLRLWYSSLRFGVGFYLDVKQ